MESAVAMVSLEVVTVVIPGGHPCAAKSACHVGMRMA
jgi:hypothetical protein